MLHRGLLPLLRLGCLLALAAFGAAARAADAPAAPAASAVASDPLGRDTPLDTVVGFTTAIHGGDAEQAAKYLEGTQSEQRKKELAQLLDTVLNRGVTLRLDKLSRQGAGHLGDGLSADLEQVGTVQLENDQDLAIVLRRVQSDGTAPIWLFSAETLKRLPAVAAQLEPLLGERIWPDSFAQRRILSLPLFVWANTLMTVPLALGLAWLFSRGAYVGLRKLLRNAAETPGRDAVGRLSGPIFLVSLSLLLGGVAPYGASMATRLFWATTSEVLAILGLAWLLLRITQLVVEFKIRRLRETGRPGRIAMTELLKWALAAVWVVGALFLVLRALGFDVSTAVAGLGVGGIAIAFAAQKTIADLFGTITVIGEEAVRVGDACRIGSLEGRVESIGLRSTRIRSLDRTLVIIPNGELATKNIENLELRDSFLCDQPIRLTRETTLGQLRQVLEGIRTMASQHPQVNPATVRVRLTGFGESSIDLQMRVHARVRGKSNFLAVQEDLLLRVMEIVESCGTRLALPARVTYPAGSCVSPAPQQEPSS